MAGESVKDQSPKPERSSAIASPGVAKNFERPTAANRVNYASGGVPRLVNERTQARWSQLGQPERRKRARVTVPWDYDEPIGGGRVTGDVQQISTSLWGTLRLSVHLRVNHELLQIISLANEYYVAGDCSRGSPSSSLD